MTTHHPSIAASIAIPIAFSILALLDPRVAEAGRPEGPMPLAASTPAAKPTAHFALIVGSNETASKTQKPLRFADDDAARMAELWLELGAEVELLTVFDQSSQARFPQLVKRAEQPSKAELDAAWARLRTKMQAAIDDGREVELLIYYAGHGDVGPDGQGFLNLAKGDTLTRADLFTSLLGSSPADHNHVIVDACRSEQFVLSRGEWKADRGPDDYGESVREYLDGNQLSAYPNTGVVLAHSVDQQTHEWERWQGGIFTHELISGLRGGADLNGDGSIEYSELGAFVSAANSGVDDPRARLEVAVRSPRGDERAPLIVHDRVSDQRVLLLAGGDAGRYSLEDGRGVRLADLNHASGQPAYLRLPAGDLFLYSHDADGNRIGEAKIPERDAGVIALARLEFDEPSADARGPLDDALRTGLFKVAYGSGFYSGYTAHEQMLAVADPEWEVHVWQRDPQTGELIEVAVVEGEDQDDDDDDEGEGEIVVTEIEIDDDCDWCWDRTWLSLSVGAEFNVLSPGGQIAQATKVRANSFPGFDDKGFPAALRGVDVRMGAFSARTPTKYPYVEGFFRSGYTEGHADFLPADESVGFATGNATHLDYLSVPLYFGGNFYFPRWPVRPYVGLGVGVDVLRVHYQRFGAGDQVAAGLRLGFEVHGGIDVRITNYFGLFGEVRQLWSHRLMVSGVPDFSNTGFTVISGLRFGFPTGPGASATNEPRKRKTIRVVETRTTTRETKVTNVVIPGAPALGVDAPAPVEPVAPIEPIEPVAPTPAPAPIEPVPSIAPTPAPAPTPSTGPTVELVPE
ncbi:caspase family protein [Nannocystaceae bacterium ST9]